MIITYIMQRVYSGSSYIIVFCFYGSSLKINSYNIIQKPTYDKQFIKPTYLNTSKKNKEKKQQHTYNNEMLGNL